MRRIILLAFLAVLACAVGACADASLYRGSGNIGSVQTIDNSSGSFVPVEDVGRLLGFTSSQTGEEVLLTKGASQLRVIANSAAAWRGLSIVPLYSSPFVRNGKMWVDTKSAVALFQSFAGAGQNNVLRFSQNSGVFAQKITPGVDVEYRKPDYEPSAPVMTASAVRVQPGSPSPVVSKTKASSSGPAPKKQPKMQTFRPGDKDTDKSRSYSGTVQVIRWTHSEGTYNKIMAVIEADDDADPQVYISGSSIHVLLAGAKANADGMESPYSNVELEAKKNSKGVDLVFKASGMAKVEKLVLNSPRRIVLDFFYPGSVNITAKGTSPTPTPRQAAQPQRQAPAIPVQPVVTSPRRTSPAVTTPPSTITIPMTPAGTRRKTVVIDPGHGGKDPGASDNGVTEKNVNLAVGLELERALSARGFKVVMTRNTDVYLTLQERTDIANRENADLFVSVHVNALPNKKSMTGFEIYIMALPTDKDAMNLAKVENREYVEGKGMDVANVDRRTEMLLKILGDMQQNNKISESTDFAAALYNAGVISGLPMRRIAQAPFFVLRGAGMPAVLLEIGFVTNAAESRLLTTQNYQQKIADAMAAGIVNYLK